MLLLGISFEDIADAALNFFIMIGIHINAMIYNIATFLFDIFISIISATIFNTEDFEKIANSVYLVIGVVALFIVSYALLRAIVDPDGAGKSNYAVKKIVPNILIAVILIAFVPFIFSNAYKLQGAVVRSNIIPNVVFGRNLNGINATDGDCDPKNGGSNCSSSEYVEYSGRMMANDVFLAFFVPTQPIGGSGQEYSDNLTNYYNSLTITNCWLFFCDGNTLSFGEAQEKVAHGEEGFGIYAEYADWMHGKDSAKNKLEYNWLLQLISGVILVYVLINFCIDMAVRVVKLGYFQIIAPIPILTIMIPGQKKIFDNWMKQSIQTFLDVFLRIFIIFMGILLINMLPDLGDDLWTNSLSPTHPNIARAFIMIGILIFMKQAPKLIADIFGISSGSFKLGIADKLGEMALVGNQAKSLVNSTSGAITGALGAGWSSKMNGGSFRNGAKYGLASGWQNGSRNPHQFNSMRQKIYNDAMGFKGKAGWFGNQNRMEKWADDVRNAYSDDFKDRILSSYVNNAEDYANRNSLIHPFFRTQMDERTTKQQRKINEALSVKNEKEAQLNQVRSSFESNKQEEISRLRQIVDNSNASYSEKIKEMRDSDYSKLANEKANLAVDRDEALSAGRTSFESRKRAQLDNLENELRRQQDLFDANKVKELEAARASLESAKALGNADQIKQFTSQVSQIEASQFNGGIIQSHINEVKKSKYEDSTEYKSKYEDYQSKIDEINKQLHELETDDYLKGGKYQELKAKAESENRGIMEKIENLVNAKAEDSEEYKQANTEYEKALNDYILEDEKLNAKTETIIRHVYDAKTKKLKEMVYNPNHTSEEDMYIDPNDEEAIKAADAYVSQVEADAVTAAIKDAKDFNETFKNREKVFNSRVKEKENEAWFNSDEGQHMNMIFGKNADKIGKGVKVNAPKDDKK